MNIKEKLKAALLAKGLKEGLSDFINITSEDQIEGVINSLTPTQDDELDFKKVLSSTEFSSYLSSNGLDKVLEGSKSLQSEFDKKVTKGIKTFKQKFVKDELEEDDDNTTAETGDSQTLKLINELKQELKAIKDGNSKSKTLDSAKELFSKSKSLSKLPERIQQRYLNSIDFEGGSSLDDQIKEFEEEAGELRLSGIRTNPGLPTGGTPPEDSKASTEEVNSIVDKLM